MRGDGVGKGSTLARSGQASLATVPAQPTLPFFLLVTERPSGPNLLELSPNNSSTDGTAAFSSSSPRQSTGTKLNAGAISFDPVDPAVRADRREALSTRKGRRSWQGLNLARSSQASLATGPAQPTLHFFLLCFPVTGQRALMLVPS